MEIMILIWIKYILNYINFNKINLHKLGALCLFKVKKIKKNNPHLTKLTQHSKVLTNTSFKTNRRRRLRNMSKKKIRAGKIKKKRNNRIDQNHLLNIF